MSTLYLLISETDKSKGLDFTPIHVSFETLFNKISDEDHKLLLQILEFLSRIQKTEARQSLLGDSCLKAGFPQERINNFR